MSLPISVLSPGKQCAGMKWSKLDLAPTSTESQGSSVLWGMHHGSTIWTSENYWEDVEKLEGKSPKTDAHIWYKLKDNLDRHWSGNRRFNVESMVVHT